MWMDREAAWVQAREEDLVPVLDYLRPKEERCVSFTARLRRRGRPQLPHRRKARIYIHRSGSDIDGALLYSSLGFVYPVLDLDSGDLDPSVLRDAVFTTNRRSVERIYSVMGSRAEVEFVERSLPVLPGTRIDYFLMVQKLPAAPQRCEVSGLRVRRALESDLDALYPLQEAYEREEVLLDQSSFDPHGCRTQLRGALLRQFVVLVERGNEPIAKAATNAMGFSHAQIGGVYTLPAYRGRGVAGVAMERLLEMLAERGRRACLFVKKHNTAAVRLYERLGFSRASEFRISYYR